MTSDLHAVFVLSFAPSNPKGTMHDLVTVAYKARTGELCISPTVLGMQFLFLAVSNSCLISTCLHRAVKHMPKLSPRLAS